MFSPTLLYLNIITPLGCFQFWQYFSDYVETFPFKRFRLVHLSFKTIFWKSNKFHQFRVPTRWFAIPKSNSNFSFRLTAPLFSALWKLLKYIFEIQLDQKLNFNSVLPSNPSVFGKSFDTVEYRSILTIFIYFIFYFCLCCGCPWCFWWNKYFNSLTKNI